MNSWFFLFSLHVVISRNLGWPVIHPVISYILYWVLYHLFDLCGPPHLKFSFSLYKYKYFTYIRRFPLYYLSVFIFLFLFFELPRFLLKLFLLWFFELAFHLVIYLFVFLIFFSSIHPKLICLFIFFPL